MRVLVAVEVTNHTQDKRTVFFGHANSSSQHHIDIWAGAVQGPVDSDALCVALIPYAEDGTAGERIELGCSNPKTGENFTDLDDGGCASAQSTDTYALLFAGLVLALRRPRSLA